MKKTRLLMFFDFLMVVSGVTAVTGLIYELNERGFTQDALVQVQLAVISYTLMIHFRILSKTGSRE